MTSRPLSRKRTRVAVAIGAAVAVAGGGTAVARDAGLLSAPSHDFGAVADSFSGHGGVSGDVLRNDPGATAVVRHTAPSDGSVTVTQKQPYVNVGTLVSQLDPSGAFFAHDKVEGVATTDGGRTLYVSNDDDFGIDSIVVDPDGKWTVHQKVLPPTGQADNGEILKVDTTKLPAVLKTVTVTVHVR